MTRTTVSLGGKTLTLSNLEKILYPDGSTKAHILDYYRRISHAILPHLKDRPLTLARYPDGVDKEFFFEKRCPPYRPDWVETARITTTEDTMETCLVNNLATLMWVENLASLELHIPLSRARSFETPDMLVFDLDPGPPADILDCAEIAPLIRSLLADLGLKSYAKTSGKKGIHIYVPLNNDETTYSDIKTFSRVVARILERNYPDRITASMAKEQRRGKIFINWSQNDPGKTMICVYSLRPAERPYVSFPVGWDELKERLKEKRSEGFRVLYSQALDRVEKTGDLFREVLTVRQRLPLDLLRK